MTKLTLEQKIIYSIRSNLVKGRELSEDMVYNTTIYRYNQKTGDIINTKDYDIVKKVMEKKK